ncbi:MAG: FKBP-type peptidyl-prolyl cis-trans isomerase N-terminal domain-containing protein [Verrucomicrobiota bacterium]
MPQQRHRRRPPPRLRPFLPRPAPTRLEVSYAVGVNLGSAWKTMHMDVDPGSVARGIDDFASGQKLQMTMDEAKKRITDFGEQFMVQQARSRREAGEKNRQEGQAFLDQNKTKPGVVTLPSGLQYKVLAAGSGASPEPDAWVSVKFQGTLINGKVVDDSSRYGNPCTLCLHSILPGWSGGAADDEARREVADLRAAEPRLRRPGRSRRRAQHHAHLHLRAGFHPAGTR